MTPLPRIYLVRHGETEWSLDGRHTGLTDVPLTSRGEADAIRLGERLKGIAFTQVFTSPLQRARRTCELAGYGRNAIVDRDLLEWNYGEYEGLTTPEIWERRPGWELFRDGCPGGETAAAAAIRADRVIARVRTVDADVLLFSSSHFLHVFAARWLGLAPESGRGFFLGTTALSILGYHHDRNDPILRLWNDCRASEER
ncbi:MAG TPA: histidine phosphatase family protein [Gemmataceae bacterium]